MRAARRGSAALAAVLLAGCAPAPAGLVPADCPALLPALVDVATLRPAPRVEIRYATPLNFTGASLPGYEEPVALLRPDAALALERVAAQLAPEGYGLKVWDAYRPVRATLAMVAWAERTGNEWVLDQGYVARRSGHNRGNTIDLTLVRAGSGEEVEMGTAYDDFSEAAHTANASGAVRENRTKLLRAMEAEGWENYPQEWWHYSYPGEPEALDVPLSCY